jgi:predicted DNA-binding protein
MKAGKPKGPGRPKGAPAKSASFRLPEELLAKLAEISRKQDRSQTTLVKRALEAYLAEHAGER